MGTVLLIRAETSVSPPEPLPANQGMPKHASKKPQPLAG